jgi:hypothetical protein
MQGLHNMLANESLFLPTVNSAIDFLPIAHIADYALKGDWLPWLLKIAGNPTRADAAGRVLPACMVVGNGVVPELAPESCGQAEAVVLPSCYGLRASVYVDFLLGFLCARTSSADRTFFAAAPPRNILHVLHLLVRRQEPGHGEQA